MLFLLILSDEGHIVNNIMQIYTLLSASAIIVITVIPEAGQPCDFIEL